MPIADLRAKSISTGVELAWSRPTRYADGDRMIDLAGFLIVRAEGDDPSAAWHPVADLEVTDRDRFRQIKRFLYVDEETIVDVEYRYQVVSYTLDGYFSSASNVVSLRREAVDTDKDSNAPLPVPRR